MEDTPMESVSLNLIFNLSFDSKLKDKMVQVGFLPKLVSLLGDEDQQVNTSMVAAVSL